MAGADPFAEKVYKIKYQLNIITSVSEESGQLMGAISESDELEIYKTDLIQDMVEYKWDKFAGAQHRFGAGIHLCYQFVLIFYVNDTFLVNKRKMDEKGITTNGPESNVNYMYAIFVCLLYPLFYDGTQAYKQGLEYLRDPWNYIDLSHFLLGFLNIYVQMKTDTYGIISKTVMIWVVFLCLIKTFFFMRIVKDFSYIVKMIINVVIDLKVFMLFFAILICMFSMIFDVISKNPSQEYKLIGPYWGNILTTLRLSLGDFDFSILGDEGLNLRQHVLFWITWVVMVFFSSLIFLNFIIAEVSNSYENVR